MKSDVEPDHALGGFPTTLIRMSSGLLRTDTRAHVFMAAHHARIQRLSIAIVLLLFPVFCLLSWCRLCLRRLFGRKPSVLWGPTPIINIAGQSELLREAGYESRTLVFNSYFITNKFDWNMKPVLENVAMNSWFTGALFLWSLLRFDTFQFFYDGGIWSGMKMVKPAYWWELPMLRLAGKRIVASAYGADVRTRARDEHYQSWNICRECPEPLKNCICDDVAGAMNAKQYRDWCDVLLAMGDMHDYVFGSDPGFSYWPIDTDKVEYRGAESDGGEIVIAHSPNHRHFKGTRFIEAVVDQLRAEGLSVRLDIIERVPNTEAMARYGAADIIFAQCLAGWIGFTEIEGMAQGKPVVTFIRDMDRYFGHAPGFPALIADPDNLEEVIRDLVEDPEKRVRHGRMGRDYVETHWSVRAGLAKYSELLESAEKQPGFLSRTRRQWKMLKAGESSLRCGTRSRDGVAEAHVVSDPRHAEALRAWGVFGRPALDEAGFVLLGPTNARRPDLGLTALRGMDLVHLWISTGDDRYRDEVRGLADRMGDCVFAASDISHPIEVPARSAWGDAMLLVFLSRAVEMDPAGHVRSSLDASMARVREGLANGTPGPGGLSLDAADSDREWIGRCSAWLDSVVTLDAMGVSLDLAGGDLHDCGRNIVEQLKTRSELIPNAISCAWATEDVLYLGWSMRSTPARLDSSGLRTAGNHLLRRTRRLRLKRFVSGTGPL
jgi:hypothetical protein